MRQKQAAEAAQREHDLLELGRLGNLEGRRRLGEDPAKAPKLPLFVDGTDAYLLIKIWEICDDLLDGARKYGPQRLALILSGRALTVYSRLSEEAAADYGQMMLALMKRYDLTEDG